MSFEGTEWYWCPECKDIFSESALTELYYGDQVVECERCQCSEMIWIGLVDETNGPPYEFTFWIEEVERATWENCPTCGQDRQLTRPKYEPRKLPVGSYWVSHRSDPMGFISGTTKIFNE